MPNITLRGGGEVESRDLSGVLPDWRVGHDFVRTDCINYALNFVGLDGVIPPSLSPNSPKTGRLGHRGFYALQTNYPTPSGLLNFSLIKIPFHIFYAFWNEFGVVGHQFNLD